MSKVFTHNLGIEVDQKLLGEVFQAQEGELNLYYGPIGSGKTYGATADVHDDLRRGEVVYTTWPIKVQDFDDRQSFFITLLNLLLFRKRYFYIPSSQNLHFINAETGEVDGVYTFNPAKPAEYIKFLNSLNHCILYIDEAWRVIDSYTSLQGFGIEVRSLILVTRHKFRTVNLIAQRPTSIQVTARANVNRFYRFASRKIFGLVFFVRSEYQDMVGETVNDAVDPVSIKRYFGSKRIFASYNSFYYGGQSPRDLVHFTAFDLRFIERLRVFVASLLSPVPRILSKMARGPFSRFSRASETVVEPIKQFYDKLVDDDGLSTIQF